MGDGVRVRGGRAVVAGVLAAVVATSPAVLLAPPAGSATAAEGWGAPELVSDSGADVWDLQVAVHEDRGLAAWVRWQDDDSQVLTAAQQTGGGWSPPAVVPRTRGAGELEVAYDAGGRARLVWTVGRRVLTARLRDDGTTTRPVLLHRTPGGPLGTRPAEVRLAVNAEGAAVVAWETMDDDEAPPYATAAVQAVVRDATGGWSPASTLSSPGALGLRPEVFVARSGRATLSWGERAGGAWSVRTAFRREGSAWSTPRRLTRPMVRPGVPHLAGLPSGRLAVAYAYRTRERRGVAVRQSSPSGGWSRPVVVQGARLASWLDVGLSSTGAVAAYTDRREAVRVVDVSRDGEVTRSRLEPAVDVFFGLRLVVNARGDALVAWDTVRDGDHPIRAAYRARDGQWGPVTRVSAADGDAFLGSLALTPRGEGLALWSGGDLQDRDASQVWARTYTPE